MKSLLLRGFQENDDNKDGQCFLKTKFLQRDIEYNSFEFVEPYLKVHSSKQSGGGGVILTYWKKLSEKQ